MPLNVSIPGMAIWSTILSILFCHGDLTHVTIAEDSTADSLVFHVTRWKGSEKDGSIHSLLVGTPCNPSPAEPYRTAWQIWKELAEADSGGEILYGRAPTGFTEPAPAEDLAPGCYAVSWAAKEALYFVVDAEGTAREIPVDSALHPLPYK